MAPRVTISRWSQAAARRPRTYPDGVRSDGHLRGARPPRRPRATPAAARRPAPAPRRRDISRPFAAWAVVSASLASRMFSLDELKAFEADLDRTVEQLPIVQLPSRVFLSCYFAAVDAAMRGARFGKAPPNLEIGMALAGRLSYLAPLLGKFKHDEQPNPALLGLGAHSRLVVTRRSPTRPAAPRSGAAHGAGSSDRRQTGAAPGRPRAQRPRGPL
jgi:hypothetical protein